MLYAPARMVWALVILPNISHHAFIKCSPSTEMLGTDVRGKENISNRKWSRSSSIYGISPCALSQIQTKPNSGVKPSGGPSLPKICIKSFWELVLFLPYPPPFVFQST